MGVIRAYDFFCLLGLMYVFGYSGHFFVCGCINYSLFKLFGHGSPLILVFHGIGLKGSIREM